MKRIFVCVNNDGAITFNADKLSMREMHEMNFVVTEEEGMYEVWKDRFLTNGYAITAKEADARAYQFARYGAETDPSVKNKIVQELVKPIR